MNEIEVGNKTYTVIANGRYSIAGRLQLLQWVTVAIFGTIALLYFYGYVGSAWLAGATISLVILIVGLGVPKKYLRGIAEAERSEMVNNLLDLCEKAQPDEFVTKADLDARTVEQFFDELGIYFPGEFKEVINQPDTGTVAVKRVTENY